MCAAIVTMLPLNGIVMEICVIPPVGVLGCKPVLKGRPYMARAPWSKVCLLPC